MTRRLLTLLHVRPNEAPKALQFTALGLLLQTGLGVGMSAGDAAFLSHVGATGLSTIFLSLPAVMLVYTPIFALLLGRIGAGRLVEVTLWLLVAGGVAFAVLLATAKPPVWAYYALRLYAGVWYIGLYTLFWNFTDGYFDVQDAKRLFPLFAAGGAAGGAIGAGLTALLSSWLDTGALLGLWAVLALAAFPLARQLRRRWTPLAESELEAHEAVEPEAPLMRRLLDLIRVLAGSGYLLAMTLVVFVTLILTNLIEFEYATVLQLGRSTAELTGLLGRLYALAGVANILVCLFGFNRLVTSVGVRNVGLILPSTYILTFALLFAQGGVGAALLAFFAYHTVLTAIEYNNQNLMFNAAPRAAKRQARTLVEGLAEPFASLISGALLLVLAPRLDVREIAGLGAIGAQLLLFLALGQRRAYPRALAANLRLDFLDFAKVERAERPKPLAPRGLRAQIEAADEASPGERRELVARLTATGAPALPALVSVLTSDRATDPARMLAARALAAISPAQLLWLSERLLLAELDRAAAARAKAERLAAEPAAGAGLSVLRRVYAERARRGVRLALELLGLTGRLPDADLIEASLRSSNPKVRANAMETIESAVSRRLFARILPMVDDDHPPASQAGEDLDVLLGEALVDGGGVEQAAAAQAIHERHGDAALSRLRPALKGELAELTRLTILRRLGLDAETITPVDIVADLMRRPGFADGEPEAIGWLALNAVEMGEGVIAAGRVVPFEAIAAAEARFPDLAFALFEQRHGGDHAA